MVERHLDTPDRLHIAAAFRRYYLQLHERLDFNDRFDLFLQYDIALRQAWAAQPGSFEPDNFQTGIWQSILDRASLEQQKNLERALCSHLVANQLPPRPSSANNPLPREGGTPHGRPCGSFRDSFRDSRQSSSTRIACFICGSLAHVGRQCKTSSNGYLTRTDGFWKSASGITVCFSFNGGYGCTKDPCAFAHVCSQCGENHLAQSHQSN
jgi:hypothetical protein